MRYLSAKRLCFLYFGLYERSFRPLATMSRSCLPIISAHPSRALVDEKIKVCVENLPPGLPVTLHSLHHSEDKDYWEAFGHYISDHRGAVSVADDLSFGGTYKGKEEMGLLWSMRPVPGSREALRLRKMNVCSPFLVNISVHSGHVTEGFMERTPLAATLIERWYMAPGVKRINVQQRGVRGTLFLPPGPGPYPGLLDMWGGGGGLIEYRSALLASRGYVSLALEYIKPDELQSAELAFNYFETAFNIIKEHPRVISDRVGLFGLSLGSIVSFLLAAESIVVKPSCCVCVSGSHVSTHLNSLKGFGNIISAQKDLIRLDENNHQVWREMSSEILRNSTNTIDVGKIECPVLLVNGYDDQNWAVEEYAKDILQQMKNAGNEHLLTLVQYPEAGHLIEPPYTPHFRFSRFSKNAIVVWGGATKPHSDAQEDSWRKILAFLQQHLYSNQTPRARM
ncbi:peroxisomal succinyl-coenzyme A thioesterase-like isoform X1 [Takifugu rubripes]|uniref:Acyl-CoA thioesterase 14 n=2 Tax=Takifugu rubripes TaxID=31033 RepID=H2U9S4_TAKRU|nr:peroxisomal succinyl-coenzyme A thioesterase-like isoform X1 [Takifugu rubripes]